MGAGEGSAMGTKGQPWGFLLYLLNPGRRTALHHLAVEPAWFIGPKVPYRFMRSPLRVLLHLFRETGANPASKSAGSRGASPQARHPVRSRAPSRRIRRRWRLRRDRVDWLPPERTLPL